MNTLFDHVCFYVAFVGLPLMTLAFIVSDRIKARRNAVAVARARKGN